MGGIQPGPFPCPYCQPVSERQQRERLTWLRDPDPPYLWRVGYALAACFLSAVAGQVARMLYALTGVTEDIVAMARHEQPAEQEDRLGNRRCTLSAMASAGSPPDSEACDRRYSSWGWWSVGITAQTAKRAAGLRLSKACSRQVYFLRPGASTLPLWRLRFRQVGVCSLRGRRACSGEAATVAGRHRLSLLPRSEIGCGRPHHPWEALSWG